MDFYTKVPEANNYTQEGLDDLIGANVTLQHNGQTVKGNSTKQAIIPDVNPTGKYNQNHILDTRKYEVELMHGVLYEKGRESILIKEISYHNINKYSIRKWKKGPITTKGWTLLVEGNYGTQEWIPLNNITYYNPVDTS